MIVEDQRGENVNIVHATSAVISNEEMATTEIERFRLFLARHKQLKNKEDHYNLRNALIEHLWERLGNAPFG